jgi:isopenicillin-N N-acyltransferase like protein
MNIRFALLFPVFFLAQHTPDPGAGKRPFYLEVSGTGYERGLQHGIALKSEIASVLGRYITQIRLERKRDADSVIAEFLRATDFFPAIQEWTPDLLEEVRGIADGSGQKFETVFSYQLPDELWVYFDKLDAHHCSGIGVAQTASHPAYVAQNMDLESWRHGSQTVLHIPATDAAPEQYIFTAAGLIAANGVNSASIGVCVNTLMQLSASPNGLPVAFVIRGLLTKRTGTAALEFLKSVHHASGQNYILGAVNQVYDFEASANRVVQFIPIPGGSPVFHTNHPLANNDLKEWWAVMLRAMTPELLGKFNTAVRFATLESRLAKTGTESDENTIKETLRSRDSEINPICRPVRTGAAGFTFGSTIMTLSDQPSLQVTCGPPDAAEYVLYTFHPAQH